MQAATAAIIVTHNSQHVIDGCLEALFKQSRPINQIILVDSGSSNIQYLDKYENQDPVTMVEAGNIGFSRANNLGVRQLDDHIQYVLFINPDLFLFENFHEVLEKEFSKREEPTVLTGKLLGYDVEKNTPTGRLDSTGIFRKWFGRWYDRGQGDIDKGQYDTTQMVPAICGALMCFSRTTLQKLDYKPFNPDFFMYKEDIELSLRLRKKGQKLVYLPELQAYHCRGWQPERKKMPIELREMAALNEVKMYLLHPSPYIVWALMKYILVKLFKI